ncbi:MAG: type II toxin-antitoxin system VapC family toxin [Terriglobales bacterium]
MNFLLDTNVVSEWVKPQPNPAVIAWLDEVDEDRVFVSVVTITELRYGISRLAPGRKRTQLEDWLDQDLVARFEGRVLSIDAVVANACGELLARREGAGRPLEAMDAYLAATALVHRLTLVTRNEADFEDSVRWLNPWM